MTHFDDCRCIVQKCNRKKRCSLKTRSTRSFLQTSIALIRWMRTTRLTLDFHITWQSLLIIKISTKKKMSFPQSTRSTIPLIDFHWFTNLRHKYYEKPTPTWHYWISSIKNNWNQSFVESQIFSYRSKEKKPQGQISGSRIRSLDGAWSIISSAYFTFFSFGWSVIASWILVTLMIINRTVLLKSGAVFFRCLCGAYHFHR